MEIIPAREKRKNPLDIRFRVQHPVFLRQHRVFLEIGYPDIADLKWPFFYDKMTDMQYHIITFGCQMNKSDSERIAANLEKEGYKAIEADSSAEALAKADLIVVNMCSVRQSAVDRVVGLTQKFKKLKAKTALTGCVLKRDKIKLGKFFDEIWPSSVSHSETTADKEKPRIASKFIPISYGCDNFCTYCVVPKTRGSLVCRNHKDIINDIKESVKNGIKEIWLLGQNVNQYFSEQKTKNKKQKVNFAGLLEMADKLPGDFKIRFMSPNPADFSDELIEVMAKCKKAAKFLNLPVQSGDNEILKKMNRLYAIEQYKNLIKKIRNKIPDINLSTDVIVGFPGETKKQFENTVKLFKEIKFSMAYINKYSKRPETAAFLLKDDVPLKEKKRREKILINLLALSRIEGVNKKGA